MSALSLVCAALISACGGGGGRSTPSTEITLSGTAAAGAPMSGATVTVKDSTGAEVQSCGATCLVETEGNFSVPLTTAAKGPFVLFVKNEGDEPEVSMIATAVSARVNVSPITTLIAARLAPSGDPANLASSDLTADTISNATNEIKTALQPLLEAAGLSADANPLTMTFKADSTGLDKALDILGKPNVVRSSDGKATVEIEIKTSGSDDTADANNSPAKITLTAGAAPVATGITLANMRATLPADGINIQIRALMRRMQDCFATAPADRRPTGATLASQITADVCKAIFVDNNPSKYLHNNYVVSQAGATLPEDIGGRFTGAFKGIFGSVQGLRHDLPEYRYTIKNGNTNDPLKSMEGDVVFTARWTVTDPNAGTNLGQSDVGEYQARMQGDELKLIGNQSKHDLSISAQARREEMPGAPDYAYMATGYNIGIGDRKWNHDNNTNTAKVSIYEKVVVTSPSGKIFTLRPHPSNNLDYLGLVAGSGITKSATVRLNGAYINGSTADHPSARFTNEFWGSKTEWDDTAIKGIPAQGNWKFDITLTDAFVSANTSSGTTKNFTQYRRTINRAPTLAELQAVTWPSVIGPVKSTLATASTSGPGYVALGANSTAQSLTIDGWDVPSGAWSPTHVKVYNTAWDEGADVASTARKVNIFCKGPGTHCETSNTGKFINTGFSYLQLTGRDNKRLQMSQNYSTRKTNSDATPAAGSN